MAAERQAPDAILEQSNLSGAVTDIDDDPDSPDASWLTAQSNNSDSVVRVSFPTPTGSPTTGAGLQEFRIQVRKLSGQSGDPTCRIELYENGTLVSTPLGDTTVTSTTGTVLAATWDASSLGTADGSLVECRVYGTKTGGSPSTRNTIEVGAVEWNVEYSESIPPVSGSGGVSFGASTSGSGEVDPPAITGTGSVAFGFSTAGSGDYTEPAVSGSGGVAFGLVTAGTGEYTPPAVTGTGAVTFGFSVAGSGSTGAATYEGSGGVTFGVATAGSGAYTAPAVTGSGGVAFGFTSQGEGEYVGSQAVSGTGGVAFGASSAGTGAYVPPAVTGSGGVAFGFSLAGSSAAVVEQQTVSRRSAPLGSAIVAGPATFMGRRLSANPVDDDEDALKVRLVASLDDLSTRIALAKASRREIAMQKAELTAARRGAMRDSDFACPQKRKYPIHDAAHVRNALARIADPSNDQCGRARILAAARRFGIKVEGTVGAKALMPVQSKALQPDEIDGFFDGKLPWRILAVPFGGPFLSPHAPRGVDLDNQWFSERTDIIGGHAALKATRERPVDWHHSYKPVPSGLSSRVMAGVVLGKAVLDDEPDDDGLWADLWAKYGEARLSKVKALVQRGVQLFGSGQPTHALDTQVDPDSGEILRFPLLLETITTSPQNTLAVVRPKALLDDLQSAEFPVSGELRDLLLELDDLGTEFPIRFPGQGGEVAAKARGVLSPAGTRALDDALASWESLPDTLRPS